MRWPLSRIGRFVLLAAACGALTVGAAHVVALSLVAALLTFAGALDAIDALSEELDHPALQQGYPITAEALALRHLTVPLATMTGFALIASCTAGLIAGPTAAINGILASPTIALAAIAGAALTATRTARPLTKITDIGLPPEAVAPRIITRVAAPILPLTATLLPMLATYGSGHAAILLAALPGGILSLMFLAVLLYRTRLEHLTTTLLKLSARR